MTLTSVTASRKKRKFSMSPTKLSALSFLAVIFVGSILLTMPFANKGPVKPYIDNLFVSVSAVCVTGLTPITLIDTYNVFGQVVVALLIQIGGLGFLTFLYFFFNITRRKISLTNKMVFQEALNQDNLRQLPRILKTIFIYTGTVEGIAAIIWGVALYPKYGLGTSIYYGIWHAISGFCNAGFDLLGSNSLINYQNNFLINFVACAEIILGGIGFFVVLDIHDKIKQEKSRRCQFSMKRFLHSLSLHTKIVLIMTATLLIGGTVFFLIFEFNNPKTIGHMSLPWKIGTSFFQSTTTRTAGFATVSMYDCTTASKILLSILMFIGGSPASTAGGIKTVTFALCALMVLSVYRGSDEVVFKGRRIKKRTILRAFSVFLLGLTACVLGMMIISISDPDLLLPNIMMEVFSAFGTVGLSASVTPTLSVVGKCVIMILMYTGRIGPVSLILLFARKSQNRAKKEIRYPDEDVIVG